MMATVFEILFSMFFVFGVYSAAAQVKLLARRFRRKNCTIDKRDT